MKQLAINLDNNMIIEVVEVNGGWTTCRDINEGFEFKLRNGKVGEKGGKRNQHFGQHCISPGRDGSLPRGSIQESGLVILTTARRFAGNYVEAPKRTNPSRIRFSTNWNGILK